MPIGTICEKKQGENRVSLTPNLVSKLTGLGHKVLVEKNAGIGSRFSNNQYEVAGARITNDAMEVARYANILVKVKELQPEEYYLLELLANKTLFTFLHLSGADKTLTKRLIQHNVTAIAYESVENEKGELPILKPMSRIAGVIAIQNGAHYLQNKYGGKGITLTSIPGTKPAHVVVVGGGTVGEYAAHTALRMGARVSLFEMKEKQIDILRSRTKFLFGETIVEDNLDILIPNDPLFSERISTADVLVGAVSIRGTKATRVVLEEQVSCMKRGAVIVDVSIDQGGCIWGSMPTTHENPVFELNGKIYCCIPNLPGQVPHQATEALTQASFPYLLEMCEYGVNSALKINNGLRKGLCTYNGKITCEAVAKDLGMTELYTNPETLF
jgi:alanine dehydrogenase